MIPELLTKSGTFIIGQIATLLGYLMNGIFFVLNAIGIPNIGLTIIFMTLIIWMALLPLTIRQQKFSRLQSKMQPKINAITKKYEGKKDPDSMAKQQEELQRVYKDYGVNPMGSCIQLIIQIPILFALYRVIYNIPAYVPMIKQAFFPLVDNLIKTNGASDYLKATNAASRLASEFESDDFVNGVTSVVQNTFIDVLNKFSTGEWSALAEKFSSLASEIHTTASKMAEYNNFLGLNMANSPWFMLQTAWSQKSFLGIIVAIIIPALSAITQIINVKLTQSGTQTNAGNQQMASTMRTMNIMMPLMSAWFCFTLPSGMGVYWISGSVIRSIQQIFINRHIEKIDYDALIAKNREKAKAKEIKKGKAVSRSNMNAYSNMSTRNIKKNDKYSTKISNEKEKQLDDIKKKNQNRKYKAGSLTEKANMVSSFNNASYRSNDTSSEAESDDKK